MAPPNDNKKTSFQGFANDGLKNKRSSSSFLTAGRIPPQALDMEEAVLGALLLEKNALTKVVDSLRPEMFYKEANRLIYEAVISLFQDSQPVDILTVKDYLGKQGKLELAGGVYFLTELTTKVASAANIEYHSQVIGQKYLLRELIIIGDTLVKGAYDESVDVFDLLDNTEQELFGLSETNLRRNYRKMDDLVMETLAKIEEMKGQTGGITGVPTGFRALDAYTSGFQNSDLIIIAARPAMGKTAFTLTVARNAAVQFGKGVAFFSLEMAAHQLVQRLLCAEAEIDAHRVRTGNLESYEWEQLNSKIGKLSHAPIYIDDTPGLSIMDLRAKARRLKAEKDIGILMIDYLQLMSGSTSKGGNREQEIAGISRSLKELAKELDIPVIALSQLSRAVETRGGDKKPMLSDLRESGSIEQDADVVMFLYRPEYYGLETYDDGSSTIGVAEIIIAKQRNGPVGDVRMQFIKKFAKFQDLEDHATEEMFAKQGYNSGGGDGSGSIIMPSKMNEEESTEEDDFNFPF